MIDQFKNIPERSIFIPGNVPSSKNSKQWTGKRLIWSKAALEYVEKTKWLWTISAAEFKELVSMSEKPYIVGFYFVRDSRRLFDLINPLQTVQDMMVSYGWIQDDNICEIIPVPVCVDGKYYHVDPDKAGVYIIPL